MKYLLSRFIKSLRSEEVRYFKIFNSNYLQKGKEKRTLELFDLLRDHQLDEYSEEIVCRLFDQPNQNAYYRLKSRLLANLEQSFITFHQQRDEEFIILNSIKLGTLFMARSRYQQAHAYFEIAEKQAVKQQAYHLLIIIYDKYLNLCSVNTELNPHVYIQKKKDALEKYLHIHRTEEILASINYRLHRSNFSSEEEGMVEKLEALMDEMKVTQLEEYSPAFRMKVNKLARKILLQKREFKALAKFLLKSYNTFQNEGFFTAKNHEEKIVMLVWLVNTFSREKKVDQTVEFTNKLGEAISEYNNLYYDKYVWLYYQSEMVTRILRNQPKEAISIFEELLDDPKYENIVSFYSVYINLAMLHYYCGNLEKGLEYIGKIIVSTDYRGISQFLQLDIGIVELVLSIDAGDYHYAERRYKEIRRIFRKQLTQEAYLEKKQFLVILREFISKPDAVKRTRVRERIDRFISTYSDFEIGANESLNYTIWLQSKINNQPYYRIMLDKYYER